jgi:hypothetical protein
MRADLFCRLAGGFSRTYRILIVAPVQKGPGRRAANVRDGKRTAPRILAATRKRRAHVLANQTQTEFQNEQPTEFQNEKSASA